MTTIDQRENSHVFSIMKGLGIIFVVAGHTAYSPVHNFVYLFHLAVFYFVAGYFFKDKYIDDKLLFVWKKIKSLWFIIPLLMVIGVDILVVKQIGRASCRERV